MSQPQWVTSQSSLGTIPQGVFYSVQLQTTNSQVGQAVKYQLISGLLPAGVFIDESGLIAGVPRAVVEIGGVPVEVSRDVTSKFVIRAYTEKIQSGITVIDAVNDRTFSITVSGIGAPTWITPAGSLGEFFVGTIISDLQVLYTNTTTNDAVTVSLFSGELPPGVTISDKGIFGGYIGLLPPGEISYSYVFVLSVTNGFSTDLRQFSIETLTRSNATADNYYEPVWFTADTTLFTADRSSVITPFITTPVGSIGTISSDNFFAFQFQAVDVYGNALAWEALTELPPGLTLDPNTGWLYGYIPDLGITDLTYEFYIRVFEINDPSIVSNPYAYNLTIQGAFASIVTWLTPSHLGSIDNGSTSTFYVKAVNTLELELFYRLKSGSDSELPQGLTLLPSGDISGRVSFETFTLDNGTTTFDVNDNNPYYNVNSVASANSETTFDLTYTFTVEAYSADLTIDVFKTFTILVNRVYNQPYENLYIKAMPPASSRALITELVTDANIFSPELIYRATDPNFGVSQSVVYWHAYGLTATTYENYVSSLALNHYNKNLVLGSIKTARAVDPATELTLYEVVYCDVVDNLVNNDGASVDKNVVLPYPLNENTVDQVDSVYPNSLNNMRDQVIDVVGQVSNILPLWMQSKQVDGTILGFTPAWVIAYCNPGAANHVAYNIATQYGDKLNQFDFDVDRYELDRALTYNWKPPSTYPITNIVGNGSNATVTITPEYATPFIPTEEVALANVLPPTYNGNTFVISATYGNVIIDTTNVDNYISGGTISNFGRWLPYPPISTTFDIDAHTQFANTTPIVTGGSGYAIGDRLIVPGTSVGGDTPLNDVFLTVNTVGTAGNSTGVIEGAFCSAYSKITLAGDVFANVAANTVTGNGSGARFSFTSVLGVQTTFDGGSMEFIDPSTIDSNTDEHDRYLVFPKRNILQ